MQQPSDVDIVGRLLAKLASFEFDPLGFVLWAFPWGQPGSLFKESGPEQWQMSCLDRIGAGLRDGGDAGALIREAVSAGHGVGKSAFVSWVILWAISTKARTRGIVTANTDTQLRTKTWAELAKWYSLFIAKDLFKFTATSIQSADAKAAPEWRIDQIPWSDANTEAFAGLHNKGRRLILLFDEASAISDKIYEVAEGALTDADTQILWCCFGNPTMTSGRFYEILSEQRLGWQHTNVDSRTVRFSNKALIAQWEEEYGEDHDFFRVRVRGLPPRCGVYTLISPEVVSEARRREVPLQEYSDRGVVISLDPARFGDDKSVITVRQGFKVHEQIKYMSMDTTELVMRMTDIWRKYPHTTAVVVEVVGLAGAGHVDMLRRVPGMPVIEYNPAAMRDKDSPYVNMRAECYMKMKDWLSNAEIPDDKELAEQLTTIEFAYTNTMKIQIESKADMKKRGLSSPDCADSLALSFVADTIQRKVVGSVKARPVQQRKIIWTR